MFYIHSNTYGYKKNVGRSKTTRGVILLPFMEILFAVCSRSRNPSNTFYLADPWNMIMQIIDDKNYIQRKKQGEETNIKIVLQRSVSKDDMILVSFLASVSGRSYVVQKQVLSHMLVARRRWGEEFMPISWLVMLNLGLNNALTTQQYKDNIWSVALMKQTLNNQIF